MLQLLSILKKKRLVFIDSRTTPNSCSQSIAKMLGIEVPINKCFLDNKDDYGYIKGQFKKLKEAILKEGSTIAIGHSQRNNTPKVLKEHIPIFEEAGIEFVPVSIDTLVERSRLTPEAISSMLVELELCGLVKSSGGLYSRL